MRLIYDSKLCIECMLVFVNTSIWILVGEGLIHLICKVCAYL